MRLPVGGPPVVVEHGRDNCPELLFAPCPPHCPGVGSAAHIAHRFAERGYAALEPETRRSGARP